MDCDDFRSILESSGVDVWSFIDTAIGVACSDYADELKNRRDGIVGKLYAAANCRNCGDEGIVTAAPILEKPGGGGGVHSPYTPQSVEMDDDDNDNEDEDRDLKYGDLFDDDEQLKILTIKDHLEDPEQTEESLVELLQTLADMDLTFKALKETDIGRHVNRLRKNPSGEVRNLVKQLVRKWKDLVDDWVRLKTPNGSTSSVAFIGDGDSPGQKVSRNGHHQVPDFAYSPNPHNGSSGSDKTNAEQEPKTKANIRREVPTRPIQSSRVSASAPPHRLGAPKQKAMDTAKLDSARKRLQDNYKEAENAKKQRTIQVMDIHEIPKPKNTFFAKNKSSSHARHW